MGEDFKLKFHIVEDGDGGCVILPASEQYHPIKSTFFKENGEWIQQEDFFHPVTREAVLKTPAHGDNHATTMILQKNKNSLKKRTAAGYGLMVTAAGDECHVNELPESLGYKNTI